MVVIRIWGLLKPSCLPVYTATSDTQDSMSLLFRLLTKLWICCETSSHQKTSLAGPSPAPGLLTISLALGMGPQSLECKSLITVEMSRGQNLGEAAPSAVWVMK